jgi:oligoendopeptidase F
LHWYAIARPGALQLWLQFKKDRGAAIERYKRAPGLGGSRPLPELFAATDLAFDIGPDTMTRLMDEVQHELDALPL